MGKREGEKIDKEERKSKKAKIAKTDDEHSSNDVIPQSKTKISKGKSDIISEDGEGDEESEEDEEVIVKSVTLNALDDRIAALEAELEDDSTTDEDSEGEGELNNEIAKPSKKPKNIVSASTGVGAKITCDICDIFVIGEDKLREVSYYYYSCPTPRWNAKAITIIHSTST